MRSKSFSAQRPWGDLDIAEMNGVATRLHWTDPPCRRHVNDGEEVFAELGCEHVAHPRGEARVLVVERAGSV